MYQSRIRRPGWAMTRRRWGTFVLHYRPTPSRPASEVPTTDLPRAADALRRAAGISRLLVWVDPSIGGNAAANSPSRCGLATTVTLGADLLHVDDLILHGVLAHEVAHHHLGHSRSRALIFLGHGMNAAGGCGLAALSLHLPWVAAVLLAAAGACRLVSDWLCRRCEYAADEHAVALLDAVGLPGARAVAAMVDDCAHTEPWWVRWGGWLVADHPTVRARAARLAERSAA